MDAIFVTGASEKPVYILIDNGEIHIESAADLWGGKTARETEDELRRRYKGAQVVSIGPPGERLQLIAAIINEYGRAYGRSGLAAVMGSKKLKAIVAVGDKKPEIHDRDLLRQRIKEMLDALRRLGRGHMRFGISMEQYQHWTQAFSPETRQSRTGPALALGTTGPRTWRSSELTRLLRTMSSPTDAPAVPCPAVRGSRGTLGTASSRAIGLSMRRPPYSGRHY